MSSKTEVNITYLNIILYALSYQLQRPIEPFLVRSLIHQTSSSATTPNHTDLVQNEESSINQTYGRLTSFFSLIQTIGSPLVGILLDKIGVCRTSVLVYTASATSYAILARATTPSGLYWSKVPTLLQHAFLVGQATVTESDDSLSRAAALGRMTTAYTVGATIGPALGGYLGESDLYAGARLAVWGSMLSIFLSMLYLKDHTNKHVKVENVNKPMQNNNNSSGNCTHNKSFLQSIEQTVAYLHHPTIGPLLFIKFLNGISSSAFTTILPLILANKLHFTTAELGYYMSANSFSVAVFACVGIGPLMNFLENKADKLAFWGIGSRCVSFLTFGLIVWRILTNMADDVDVALPNETCMTIILASVATSIASHAHATSLTTLTTGSVSSEERGAILGLEHGLFSMARVVGPPLGTTLLSNGPSLFGLDDVGANGLWRVIFVCVLMDFVLLALLKVWSTRQCTTTVMEVELNDSCSKPLMKDDHDHSD
jgi:OCT family organic cation transporter-like MFS transporter 18